MDCQCNREMREESEISTAFGTRWQRMWAAGIENSFLEFLEVLVVFHVTLTGLEVVVRDMKLVGGGIISSLTNVLSEARKVDESRFLRK